MVIPIIFMVGSCFLLDLIPNHDRTTIGKAAKVLIPSIGLNEPRYSCIWRSLIDSMEVYIVTAFSRSL